MRPATRGGFFGSWCGIYYWGIWLANQMARRERGENGENHVLVQDLDYPQLVSSR